METNRSPDTSQHQQVALVPQLKVLQGREANLQSEVRRAIQIMEKKTTSNRTAQASL